MAGDRLKQREEQDVGVAGERSGAWEGWPGESSASAGFSLTRVGLSLSHLHFVFLVFPRLPILVIQPLLCLLRLSLSSTSSEYSYFERSRPGEERNVNGDEDP